MTEQAAWVQAVGSLLGIGVAIAVPATLHGISIRRARLASDLRAKALGLSLRTEIDAIGERLNAVWYKEHPDKNGAPSSPGEPRDLGPHTMAALAIAPSISHQINTLHEMGAAGQAALSCIHSLMRAKEAVSWRNDRGTPVHYTLDPNRFYDFLWDATQSSASAINLIDSHFKVPPRPRDG